MPAKGRVIFHATTDEDPDGYHFTDPVAVHVASIVDDVPKVLDAVEEAAQEGYFAAGYIAYEAGAALEKSVPRRSIDVPYAWFGIYEDADRMSRRDLEQLLSPADARIAQVRFSVPKPRYRKQVAAIRELIREGDVYQINYTGQLRFTLDQPADALFHALVKRQPVPYAAYLDIGDAQILSCSPELFFRREGRRIVTRPMKGTATRGASAEEDEERARHLAADVKNRAENVMIVDLLRNDLSRCCVAGSVRTPKLFETERYETLIQMSSEIEGELEPDAGLLDIFTALFPCGSITGAPKIRAMQRIDALEDEQRGVYCGAVGFVRPGGDAVFNVAIRTSVVREGTGRLGIGSGIVWDSEADAEFSECLLKAQFLAGSADLEAEPFYLIETMRAEDGRIVLLDLHMDRLQASAAAFGIPLHRSEVEGRISAELPDDGDYRVRLTLDQGGAVRIERSPADPKPDHWRAAISGTHVDAQDPLLRHKTSRRSLYNEKLKKAQRLGYDEVLFLNARGEVTEGARSNIFIRNGRSWRTPPIGSGALPGVYRRHLIDSLPGVSEVVLYIHDVLGADAVYFCNAVAGLVEAEVLVQDEAYHDAPAREASCMIPSAQD